MVSIAGALDGSVADAIQQTLEAALTRHPEVLRVDLAKVRLLDSQVMAVLWRMHKAAAAQNTVLIVCNPNEFVTLVLEVAGFLKELPVERDHGGATTTG
ncbi:STAS domain-containing protein [Dactylosporangium sp. NPDC000521]|uniref:STAS domain-containing protein n=1 Tax=Dactylosporangium sp. NPDC000521 TaxID=3363975 RepID=UPI0036A963B5